MNVMFYMPTSMVGGVRRVTEILSNNFEKKGHSVIWLIHDRFYNDYRDFPEGRICHYLPSRNLLDNVNVAFYNSIINKYNIDAIINQDGLYEGVGLIDRINNQTIPRISVIHSNPISNFQWLFRDECTLRNNSLVEKFKRVGRIVWYPITKKRVKSSIISHFDYLGKSDACICVLSPQYLDIIRKFNLNVNNVVAIQNPNTYETMEVSPKEHFVLFVGRLDNRSKKVQYLLNIWKRIMDDVDDWKLIIIGEGQDSETLRQQACKLKNVEFIGYKNPKHYYEKASILCMTSIFEGFPMALTEAMQHGCVPIVYNSFPAVNDIITNGEDGIIIPPFDKEEYSQKLLQLINNEEYRNRLSKAAIKSVTRFDAEKIIEQWINLIKELRNE